MKKLGLIVNPIAGMGGRVGLKGTDGPDILKRALALGAKPQAQDRTREALEQLAPLMDSIQILTYPGQMGEVAARQSGFSPAIVGALDSSATSAEDTRKAAKEIKAAGADLLLFVGGDGTARDICESVGESIVALGVPAGVKIHSAVFASNPHKAGELASLSLINQLNDVCEAEVMDIDEGLYRRDILSTKLYGYLKIPYKRQYLQGAKAGSLESEKYAQEAVAAEVVENMADDFLYIIGPGTTTRAVMRRLHLEGSLLGVDLIYKKKLIGKDLNEAQLLAHIKQRKVKAVLAPIGGQGYVLGRGNQQLSPEVIELIGKENIILVATKHKIHALCGRPLLVDTGDREIDRLMKDYFRVITGYREAIIYRMDS